MNKFFAVLVILTGLTGSLFAQKITMEKSWSSTWYILDDSIDLSSQEVLHALKDNAVAFHEFKIARKNATFSAITGSIGGVLIALPLIEAVMGGNPEWKLAAAGGALVICSIPLSRAATRHSQIALDEYNSKLSSRLQSRLYFTATGARIIIRF